MTGGRGKGKSHEMYDGCNRDLLLPEARRERTKFGSRDSPPGFESEILNKVRRIPLGKDCGETDKGLKKLAGTMD